MLFFQRLDLCLEGFDLLNLEPPVDFNILLPFFCCSCGFPYWRCHCICSFFHTIMSSFSSLGYPLRPSRSRDRTLSLGFTFAALGFTFIQSANEYLNHLVHPVCIVLPSLDLFKYEALECYDFFFKDINGCLIFLCQCLTSYSPDL